MKRIHSLLLVLTICITVSGQNKELVMAELNYCTMSLQNIENNGSIETIEHELWQIDANLKRTVLSQIDEASEFVKSLQVCLDKMKINEAERYLISDILARKRETQLWESLSGALSPTMVITSGSPYQIAANALLTVARTAVDYKVSQNNMEIEELREMWAISKRNLEAVSSAKEKSLDLGLKMFKIYHLEDSARMNSEKSKHLFEALSQPTPSLKVQRLESLRNELGYFMDYYYYLGMAYLDDHQWPQADSSFDTYLSMYAKAPIFNYDEKSGCIALARLANEIHASDAEKRSWISVAMNNLKDNGPVAIQCAFVYLADMKDYYNGLKLIKDAIINPSISDNAVLVRLAVNYMDQLKQIPSLNKEMDEAVANCRNLDILDYIRYLIVENSCDLWNKLDDLIKLKIEVISYLPKNKSDISFPNNFMVDPDLLSFFMTSGDRGLFDRDKIYYRIKGTISEDTIYSKLSVVEKHHELKSLFFDKIGKDAYVVRNSVSREDILNGNIMGISSYSLTKKDKQSIADFCDKYRNNLEEKNTTLTGDTYIMDAVQRKILNLWNGYISTNHSEEIIMHSKVKVADSKIIYLTINQDGYILYLYFRQTDDCNMEPFAIYNPIDVRILLRSE